MIVKEDNVPRIDVFYGCNKNLALKPKEILLYFLGTISVWLAGSRR